MWGRRLRSSGSRSRARISTGLDSQRWLGLREDWRRQVVRCRNSQPSAKNGRLWLAWVRSRTHELTPLLRSSRLLSLRRLDRSTRRISKGFGAARKLAPCGRLSIQDLVLSRRKRGGYKETLVRGRREISCVRCFLCPDRRIPERRQRLLRPRRVHRTGAAGAGGPSSAPVYVPAAVRTVTNVQKNTSNIQRARPKICKATLR